jgi:hypothetical protein
MILEDYYYFLFLSNEVLYFIENKVQHRTERGRNPGTPLTGEKTKPQKEQPGTHSWSKQQSATKRAN